LFERKISRPAITGVARENWCARKNMSTGTLLKSNFTNEKNNLVCRRRAARPAVVVCDAPAASRFLKLRRLKLD
jgi:hypothetical protein